MKIQSAELERLDCRTVELILVFIYSYLNIVIWRPDEMAAALAVNLFHYNSKEKEVTQYINNKAFVKDSCFLITPLNLINIGQVGVGTMSNLTGRVPAVSNTQTRLTASRQIPVPNSSNVVGKKVFLRHYELYWHTPKGLKGRTKRRLVSFTLVSFW